MKEDRRIKRTQKSLSEALMALTSERGYESITIRDLTERAEIGYATFFRHYKSKDELLHAALNTMIGDFMDLMPDPFTLTASREKGLILFRYVDQHTDLCRMLLGSQGSNLLFQQILRLGTEMTVTLWRQHISSHLPLEVVAHQLVSSALMLVRWWLDGEKPYPPEQMSEIYSTLIIDPLNNVLHEKPESAG